MAVYFIVARGSLSGKLGVAVQSHWFSVGPIVPWARPGVGAVGTQSLVDPAYGPLGLELMAMVKTAQVALIALLAGDAEGDLASGCSWPWCPPRPREATCAAGSRRPSSWSPPKKRAALGLTGCSTCVWKIILSQWKNCAATEVVPDEATGGEAPFSVGVTLASEGREQEAAAYLLRALAQNDRRSAPSHGALNYSG